MASPEFSYSGICCRKPVSYIGKNNSGLKRKALLCRPLVTPCEPMNCAACVLSKKLGRRVLTWENPMKRHAGQAHFHPLLCNKTRIRTPCPNMANSYEYVRSASENGLTGGILGAYRHPDGLDLPAKAAEIYTDVRQDNEKNTDNTDMPAGLPDSWVRPATTGHRSLHNLPVKLSCYFGLRRCFQPSSHEPDGTRRASRRCKMA